MNGKILQKLEYVKIIDKLQACAATTEGKQRGASLTPSSDVEEVKRRLAVTDEAVAVNRLKGGAPFGGIRHISPALKRAAIGSMLQSEELLDIALTIAAGRKLKRFLLAMHEEQPLAILSRLVEQISDLRACEDQIKACINDQAEVSDQASPELARLRREIRTTEIRIRERLDQTVRSQAMQKLLQEALVTMRNDRYVIPVKQEYRGQFPGIVHDQSSSGATLFIEPEFVVTLNNALRELKSKEAHEIEKILRMLTAQVADVGSELQINVDLLAELDFIFAKAALAHTMKATLPMMNDRGYIKLMKARHPLILETAVPIDLELGDRYTSMIVTGPNTGGKTVSLKTVGLLNLMAMSGLFIPAEDGSQLSVFDRVYADIGDEQSIEQNLSTFSSHMSNIIQIIKEMTANSLVLLDELGAGTDPAEGSALAIAILEHIHQSGCRLIATTHFSELKAYAYDRKGIINASMEFDVRTLRPTYRLLVGVPGRSNAFAIAERLGLPMELIDHARGQVGEEDQRVESMIATLEEQRITSESEKIAAETMRKEAERLKRKLTEQQRSFDAERDKLLMKAEQEAKQVVDNARKQAETIVAELRQLALEEGAAIKEHRLIEARKKLEEAMPAIQPLRTKGKRNKSAPIQVGDDVMVLSLGRQGQVVDLASDSELFIQLGAMKMKVNRNDVEWIRSHHLEQSTSTNNQATAASLTIKRSRDEQVKTELDLRGIDLEQSLIEADRFLDEAYLANLGQVYIIHGKGTGALRNGIQQYLRKHRLVQNFRLGNYGEGGSGVTVVQLSAK